MDFWDLTRLLVRRWMILLPMLVLSGAVSVQTMSHVKPTYVTTAYVQLMPPKVENTDPDAPTPSQRNPWIGLGLDMIGNAAIVIVMDHSVSGDLSAHGYSGVYTLTQNERLPLVTLEVTGNSSDQATQTAGQLVGRFSQAIAGLQQVYDVPSEYHISARRLDNGTNVTTSLSTRKRAVAAVAGVSLLTTVGVTIALDVPLTRRRRRRDAAAAAATAATATAAATEAAAGPAEVAEPAEAAEPTETAETAEPTETAETAEPTETAETAEPTEVAETAERTEIAEAAEPAEVADPAAGS